MEKLIIVNGKIDNNSYHNRFYMVHGSEQQFKNTLDYLRDCGLTIEIINIGSTIPICDLSDILAPRDN